MTDGGLETITLGAEQTQIKVQCRMVESGFEGVLEFFGSLILVVLRLRVDGLTQMQDNLGLFGLLHGESDRCRA